MEGAVSSVCTHTSVLLFRFLVSQSVQQTLLAFQLQLVSAPLSHSLSCSSLRCWSALILLSFSAFRCSSSALVFFIIYSYAFPFSSKIIHILFAHFISVSWILYLAFPVNSNQLFFSLLNTSFTLSLSSSLVWPCSFLVDIQKHTRDIVWVTRMKVRLTCTDHECIYNNIEILSCKTHYSQSDHYRVWCEQSASILNGGQQLPIYIAQRSLSECGNW